MSARDGLLQKISQILENLPTISKGIACLDKHVQTKQTMNQNQNQNLNNMMVKNSLKYHYLRTNLDESLNP